MNKEEIKIRVDNITYVAIRNQIRSNDYTIEAKLIIIEKIINDRERIIKELEKGDK